MRREHAVVEHEVDPQPWRERAASFSSSVSGSNMLARAVRPRGLEREHDADNVQEPQPVSSSVAGGRGRNVSYDSDEPNDPRKEHAR
jgi:hypothetical protein